MACRILGVLAASSLATFTVCASAADTNRKFITKIDINWEDKNVVEGIAEICKDARIKLVIDEDAIQKRDLASSVTSQRSRDLPLLPALRRIARFYNLYVYALNDELRLTTLYASGYVYRKKTYALQGVRGALSTEQQFFDDLEAIETESWVNYGGEGEALGVENGHVLINQCAKTHDELAKFFLRAELAFRGQPSAPLPSRALQKSLSRKRGLDAGKANLEDQLQTLLSDVPYLIDRSALSEAAIDLSATLPVTAKRDQLVELLTQFCDENGLAWFVDDGIVVITSTDGIAADYVYRVYNVRKHITPSFTPQMMAAKVESTAEFGEWFEITAGKGDAVCRAFGPLLVIFNDRLHHKKIADAIE